VTITSPTRVLPACCRGCGARLTYQPAEPDNNVREGWVCNNGCDVEQPGVEREEPYDLEPTP
jgi:hypothetical protein